MQLCIDIKRLCTSIRGLKLYKRGKETKRSKPEIVSYFSNSIYVQSQFGFEEERLQSSYKETPLTYLNNEQSKPFNFKREITTLPGLSEDEYVIHPSTLSNPSLTTTITESPSSANKQRPYA